MSRSSIPQRRRIFLGCEGDSERGYGALLRELLEERRRDVHLDVVLLRPGGGDPLVLVERAQEFIRRGERAGAPRYVHKALLLDDDLRGADARRDRQAERLASQIDLHFIWQTPCHEAFLLRHLQNCDQLRPLTNADARRRLIKAWTGYEKGLPASRLAQRITASEVERASAVEQDLLVFLQAIGFL